MLKLPFALLLFLVPHIAQAKLTVVATIQDLAALAREVGGDEVSAESIAKGTQDPHFIEAKPSYMVKVSKADLLLAVGLDLEVGWLPSLVQGARNPKVNRGKPGYLELGPLVDPLEVPSGKVTRAEGDVHPDGNPHFWLDPERLAKAASLLAERFGELAPEQRALFRKNADAFGARMKAKSEGWRKRIEKSGVEKVVSYHKTLSYFLQRFGLANAAYLEPKPGIPPTSGHLIGVLATMKKEGVRLILVENYFDASVTKKLTGEVPGARAAEVAVSVGGKPGLETSDELIEQLVAAIEGK